MIIWNATTSPLVKLSAMRTEASRPGNDQCEGGSGIAPWDSAAGSRTPAHESVSKKGSAVPRLAGGADLGKTVPLMRLDEPLPLDGVPIHVVETLSHTWGSLELLKRPLTVAIACLTPNTVTRALPRGSWSSRICESVTE